MKTTQQKRQLTLNEENKLDEFAAAALNGLLASPTRFGHLGTKGLAKRAYEMAEAMIDERNERGIA